MADEILRAQRRILQLVDIARRAEVNSAEGRNAAMLACKLIHEHGFLVIHPSELVPLEPSAPCAPPPAPAPKKRSRPAAKTIRETSETVVNVIDDTANVIASVGRAANVAADVLEAFTLRRR